MTRKAPGGHGPSFALRISRADPGTAYLRRSTHSGRTARMSRSVRLVDVLGSYQGPDVVLDFDEPGVLVGIEVLA